MSLCFLGIGVSPRRNNLGGNDILAIEFSPCHPEEGGGPLFLPLKLRCLLSSKQFQLSFSIMV
jgi:hypothetical protein